MCLTPKPEFRRVLEEIRLSNYVGLLETLEGAAEMEMPALLK